MKTIHVSDGLWKRLKLESVERGVPMREVVEEMGSAWGLQKARPIRASVDALTASEFGSVLRELKVELEE